MDSSLEAVREHNSRLYQEELATRTVPLPRLLFKYTNFDAAVAILQTQRLRFRTPAEFNDPFDSEWNILWQIETPEFRELLVRRFVAEDFDLDRIEDAEIRLEVERLRARYAGMTTADEREEFVEVWKTRLAPAPVAQSRLLNARRQLRLLCLSEIHDSIQMWSYYADHHKGVVLGFDASALEQAWLLPARRVEYVSQLPPFLDPAKHLDVHLYGSQVPEVDGAAASRVWTTSKAVGWSHEREWRFALVEPLGKPPYADVPFPAESLVKVFAGCRADPASLVTLEAESASRYPNASLRLLAPARAHFGLVELERSK